MTSSRFSQPSWSDAAGSEFQYSSGSGDTSGCASSPAEIILSSETTTRVCDDDREFPAPQAHPCGVFVPENYEPNYAYPLVVWLHDAGRSERDIVDVLPHISMRNYLGLALRGTNPADPRVDNEGRESAGYRWSRSQR